MPEALVANVGPARAGPGLRRSAWKYGRSAETLKRSVTPYGDPDARLVDVVDHVRGGAIALGQALGRVLGVLLHAAHEMPEGPEMAISERRLPLTLGQVVGLLAGRFSSHWRACRSRARPCVTPFNPVRTTPAERGSGGRGGGDAERAPNRVRGHAGCVASPNAFRRRWHAVVSISLRASGLARPRRAQVGSCPLIALMRDERSA